MIHFPILQQFYTLSNFFTCSTCYLCICPKPKCSIVKTKLLNSFFQKTPDWVSVLSLQYVLQGQLPGSPLWCFIDCFHFPAYFIYIFFHFVPQPVFFFLAGCRSSVTHFWERAWKVKRLVLCIPEFVFILILIFEW